MDFTGYMARPQYDENASYLKVKQNGLTLNGVEHAPGTVLEISKLGVDRGMVARWWSTRRVDMLSDTELDELTKPTKRK